MTPSYWWIHVRNDYYRLYSYWSACFVMQTEEERKFRAAVIIQSHYRGYIDRCKFLEMLYDQYEKVSFCVFYLTTFVYVR